MTKFAVAILLLALMMPASAEDTDSANYFLPGCKGFCLVVRTRPCGRTCSASHLFRALCMQEEKITFGRRTG
jgi:hypothetical protein